MTLCKNIHEFILYVYYNFIGGIRSVYKGSILTLCRDIPASGAYFAGYEGIKRLMTPAGQDPSKLSVGSILVAGKNIII